MRHNEQEFFASARIILVDDNPQNLEAMHRILQRDYKNCELFSDPRKAIERIASGEVDLLVLDWHMPNLSGAGVVKALREKMGTGEIPPVLVLTADTWPETRREALAAGVTDFLTKPVDATELILRMRNSLRMWKLHLEARRANDELESQVKHRTAELEGALAQLREMQAHAIQQERLHALGTMAAGIAHDFNNALAIIRGYGEMYSTHPKLCEDPARVHQSFSAISAASLHAAEVVGRLRDFYRPYRASGDERSPVRLNELLEASIGLCAPRWQSQAQSSGARIEIDTDLQTIPPVLASASELKEVILNLIFNAVDAMPKGGRIVVRSGVDPDGLAFFEVEDTGIGMSEQTRRRCLEPFFTTKGENGTGLGLSIAFGIVRRHNGSIRIHSEIGSGTRITIAIPITDESTNSKEPEATARQAPPMRVLVVDDQPEIRKVLQELLSWDGHQIYQAPDAPSALDILDRHHIELVLTDHAMPGMNGAELATAIKRRYPLIPVVMLTAFFTDDEQSKAADLVLHKPATLQTLRHAISQVVKTESREVSESQMAAA